MTTTALQQPQVLRRSLFLVVAAWVGVLIAHQIPVGGVWLPIEWTTWAAVVAWPTLFAIGFAIIGMQSLRRAPTVSITTSQQDVDMAIILLSAAGLLGALLVVYEFAFVRGYGFGTSAAEIRISEVTQAARGLATSSPISGLGRLLIPAIIPALVLALRDFRGTSQITKIALAGSFVVISYEQAAFEGGRTLLIGIFVIAVVCMSLGPKARTTKRNVNFARFVALGAGFAILTYFVGSVFVTRILDSDRFFWSSYLSFSSSFTISVDSAVVSRFDGIFGPFWYAISMFWLYITQGVNELDTVLSVPNLELANGLYQLPQIAGIASILFGADLNYDVFRNLPNTGTYLTAYGANYVDFGHFGGIASAFLLGGLTAHTMAKFSRNNLSAGGLMGPSFLAIGLFSPVISLVTSLSPSFFWAIGAAVFLRGRSRAAANFSHRQYIN